MRASGFRQTKSRGNITQTNILFVVKDHCPIPIGSLRACPERSRVLCLALISFIAAMSRISASVNWRIVFCVILNIIDIVLMYARGNAVCPPIRLPSKCMTLCCGDPVCVTPGCPAVVNAPIRAALRRSDCLWSLRGEACEKPSLDARVHCSDEERPRGTLILVRNHKARKFVCVDFGSFERCG